MVKIKEGYVMSAREQAEYDRKNALPRKSWGRVEYYFKPQTKYPLRVYIFMHAEIWCDRNRRPMGLYYALPFLSRPMNKEEIEYHHFDHRLCYHQYEDWDRLIYAEEQEAGELDKECTGSGEGFLKQVKSLRQRFDLKGSKPVELQTDVSKEASEEQHLVSELIANGRQLDAKEIGKRLEAEQNGLKRIGVLILLRDLYKNVVVKERKVVMTLGRLNRKIFLSRERTRKNFVRRIFKVNKLFALPEIRQRYPDYNEEMLFQDLLQKRGRTKRKKHKPVLDLRRCQLQKLAAKLIHGELSEKEYHHICCRMVMLQQAHDLRLPIPLTVRLDKKVSVYSFDWKIRERTIKAFVDTANADGMTHALLKKRYGEIVSSPNSY